MKPHLKIGNLSDLQDARYCAAVGVSMLEFCLERGNPKKITPELVSEITQWLEGPKFVGYYGYETPDEINEEARKLNFSRVSVPEDYHPDLLKEIEAPLILRLKSGQNEFLKPDFLESISKVYPACIFEVNLQGSGETELLKMATLGILERTFLGFYQPDTLWNFLSNKDQDPFGFSLGDYILEPNGQLDYEKCDLLMEEFHKKLTE